MEVALAIFVILALIAGAIVLVRQGSLPWLSPITRAPSGADHAPPVDDGPERLPDPGHEPGQVSAGASVVPMPIRASGALEPIRRDVNQPVSDGALARLDRIEARVEELHRAVANQNDLFAQEARRFRAELTQRAEAEEARRDAAQDRLRADLLALVTRALPERSAGGSARRMEVSAEVYAQLARLEAALATVTNPILLPGEPFAPPAELLPETFVWENWNEVGERAFALAETYSAQRLHMSAQTRADVGAFVTTLRALLTRSVYPNVQGSADQAHQAALQTALAEIAAELPKIRELLETEYMESRST